MTMLDNPIYYRACWPDTEVPAGEPIWLHYEVSKSADAVLRVVEVFEDRSITRNSIEIEQRNGDHCPSLFDCPVDDGLEGVVLEELPRSTFEELWERGVDTPFWFVR